MICYYVRDERVYAIGMCKVMVDFLDVACYLKEKPNSYATDQADPNPGIRPCIPRVPLELTDNLPRNISISMTSLIKHT